MEKPHFYFREYGNRIPQIPKQTDKNRKRNGSERKYFRPFSTLAEARGSWPRSPVRSRAAASLARRAVRLLARRMCARYLRSVGLVPWLPGISGMATGDADAPMPFAFPHDWTARQNRYSGSGRVVLAGFGPGPSSHGHGRHHSPTTPQFRWPATVKSHGPIRGRIHATRILPS